MAKEYFKNLPDTSTPLTATRFNGLLDGDESMGDLVVENIKSKNMFDKNNIIKGYLYTSTGDTYADSDKFISIPYIKVEPNANYTFSATNVDIFRFIEYDSSKNFIQRQIAPAEVNSKTYTTSSTTEYVRISCNISNLSSLQLEKGSAVTTYSPYNAYGSNNLKDENIVVGSIRSKNIFTGFHTGTYDSTTGAYNPSGDGISTNKIKVDSGETYYLTGVESGITIRILYWNDNTYVTSETMTTLSGGNTITPQGNYLVIQTGTNVTYSNVQLELGDTATSYLPHNAYGSSNFKNEEIIVGSIRSKNLLNPNASISGAITVNSTSEATDGNTNAVTTGWIPCKPSTTYKISGGHNRLRWQTKATNGTITFAQDGGSSLLTNSSARWLRCYFYYGSSAVDPTSIKNVQIEEGTAITTFTPYQNLDGQEIYSTGEVKIGAWIDGKPLYRKVFEITTYATSFNVSTPNIERLVNIQGMLQRSDFPDIYEPIPSRLDNTGMSAQFGIITKGNTTNINVILGSNWQNVFNRIIFILEYTKTTD